MALKDITITGSIGSIPTQSYGQKMYISSTDEQSFPIEQFGGGTGGVFPNLEGNISSSNLIVNITQSWSGSINTPSGIVQFVHDTQEEFYNGEFSGSNLVVADQRLSDEQTIQLLTPSTVPVDYSVFYYYASGSRAIPINNFLNPVTSPNDGEIYLYYSYNTSTFSAGGLIPPQTIITPTGIIYAKIARKDHLGNDNTLSLQGLTNFSFNFSDVGIVNYTVSNITVYPNYYLYGIVANTAASVTDNNILNHKLAASSTINLIPAGVFTRLTSSWSTISDPLNYFNNGIYTFGDTPNIPIIYTASIGLTVVNTTGFIWGISDFQNSSSLTASNAISLAPGTYTLTLSGSTNDIIENNAYEIGCFSNSQLFVTSLTWTITQSVPPQLASSSTALQPYANYFFEYSDSNVLFNNALDIVPNDFYRKIIFDNGSTIPSNYQQIMSRSAEFADVKEYYYNLQRQVIPRYLGSKSTSNNFNLNTIEGGFGTLPNVEKNSTYFAAVKALGPSEPEILNDSIATLQFLVDVNGDTFELNNDPTEISYYNSTFTFEQDKLASISNTDGDIFLSRINKSGYDVYPVLYSDLGLSYATTLSFSDGNVGNYLLNSDVQGLYGQGGNLSYAPDNAIFSQGRPPNRDNNSGKEFPYSFYNINTLPDPTLVTILSGSVDPAFQLNVGFDTAGSGNQGGDGKLAPLLTGSFYHIYPGPIPNTALKFRLNKMKISFGYPSGTIVSAGTTFQLDISIVKTIFGNLNNVGGIYEWNVENPTITTTLVKHTYTCTVNTTVNGVAPINGPSTQVNVIDTFSSTPYPYFQRDFIGNGRDVFGLTEIIETDFISTLQVDDVIGVYFKLTAIPPQGSISINAKYDQFNYTRFEVISNPSPATQIVTSGSFPFFSTASGNPYRLIATTQSLNTGDPFLATGLANILNSDVVNQNYITGSGYKPFRFLGSRPEFKDEIRFEHKEAYTHVIRGTGIITGSNNEFYIDLESPILPGTNLDWFLIRRYAKNPSKLILDIDNINITGGFIYPEYMSEELKNKIPQIIQKLKIQNLI